jgi:hypothetical protein
MKDICKFMIPDESGESTACRFPAICSYKANLADTTNFLIDYYRFQMNNVLHSFRDSNKTVWVNDCNNHLMA